MSTRPRVSSSQKRSRTPFYPSMLVTTLNGREKSVKTICCHCKKLDKIKPFVDCKGGCSAIIHVTCLKSICDRLSGNEEQTWKCNDCQTCTICNEGILNGKPSLKCYICFAYYHSQCLGMDRAVKKIRFRCHTCEEKTETEMKKSSTIARNIRRKPRSKSVSETTTAGKVDFLGFDYSEIRRTEDHIESMKRRSTQFELHSPPMQRRSIDNANGIDNDTSIPDVSKWSVNEVFAYFKRKFPMHAHAFKEEEIDGQSLLLLEREDVVKGLKIKIGVAVKIYDHILQLKKKISDSTSQQ